MALILLVDPSDVARRALRGILARGSHRLATVGSEQEAWNFLRQVVKIDLLFTELKIADGNGLALVQRLKADPFLKHLPVVVYTEHGDRDVVKRTLDLKVQNFLIKPYHDTDIFTEIKKATTNPWRARHLLGCTTAEMATHFAEKQGLPRRFVNVMRWVDAPAEATEDAVLVAVVSMARDLCRQNHVGTDGGGRREHALPLADTAEWRILSGSVYPSFNLKKFEHQAHAACRELQLELHGRANTQAA